MSECKRIPVGHSKTKVTECFATIWKTMLEELEQIGNSGGMKGLMTGGDNVVMALQVVGARTFGNL